MSNMKKLKRSRNSMFAGVCAGVAEYFEVDVTLVRILWVIFSFGAAGILAYIICMILMPAS